MVRTMLTILVFAFSVIFVASATAAEQEATASAIRTESRFGMYGGVVERVDVAKRDFSVKSGNKEITFSLSDGAKITEGKKTLSFADLKKGQEVTVEYTEEGTEPVADIVRVIVPQTTGME